MKTISPVLVLLAAIAVPVRAVDAPADLESAASSARGIVKSAQLAGKESAERQPSLTFASNVSGTLECKCTEWGGDVRMVGQVCTHRYCPSGDNADCRRFNSWKCDEWKTANYLQSTCGEWKQSFCYDFQASLAPADAAPGASGTMRASVDSCRRWISYDAQVTRCPTLYKFLYYGGELDTGGQSWSNVDPWGNSSCRTKNVLIRECAD